MTSDKSGFNDYHLLELSYVNMIQYARLICISLNLDVSVLVLQNTRHFSKQAYEKETNISRVLFAQM